MRASCASTWRCWLLAGFLAALAGCQTGGENKWWVLKNPFKPSDSATNSPPPQPAFVPQPPRVDVSSLPVPPPSVDRTPNLSVPEPPASLAQGPAPASRSPEQLAQLAAEMSRAKGLEREGNLEEARALYERLIDQYPDRYEPYHRLAVVADRQKRFTEAQGLYRQAVRLNPRNPDLYNDLGYCLFLQGRYDDAEAEIVRAVKIAPTFRRYHNNLGMVYGYQRRYDEAMVEFRRGGSEADACYNLAFVLAAKNDADGAKNYFRRALEAEPRHGPAQRALAMLEQGSPAVPEPVAYPQTEPVIADGVQPASHAVAEREPAIR